MKIKINRIDKEGGRDFKKENKGDKKISLEIIDFTRESGMSM